MQWPFGHHLRNTQAKGFTSTSKSMLTIKKLINQITFQHGRQNNYARKSDNYLENRVIIYYLFFNLVSSALICSTKSEKWNASYLFVVFRVKQKARVALLNLHRGKVSSRLPV